jgi:hypothetical protein
MHYSSGLEAASNCGAPVTECGYSWNSSKLNVYILGAKMDRVSKQSFL